MSDDLNNPAGLAEAAAARIMGAIGDADFDRVLAQIDDLVRWLDILCRPEEFAAMEAGGSMLVTAVGRIDERELNDLTSMGDVLIKEVTVSRDKAVAGIYSALDSLIDLIRRGDLGSAQNIAWQLTGQCPVTWC